VFEITHKEHSVNLFKIAKASTDFVRNEGKLHTLQIDKSSFE
jgi:hypothetical protein